MAVFNPPREILRTPGRLKEMHDAGFRLKCLVNEACLMGCLDDAYLAEDNSLPLAELMLSGTLLFAANMLPREILRKITVDKVPDKLLTCECRECERCGLCERILAEIIPEEYRERFQFKIKVT